MADGKVVVTGAGNGIGREFARAFNMSVEEWKAMVDVHLKGSFYVSPADAPHFRYPV